MLRTTVIILLLTTNLVNLALFVCKWMDTDLDTAWKALEDHVDNCAGAL